jgi:hypothetical protein
MTQLPSEKAALFKGRHFIHLMGLLQKTFWPHFIVVMGSEALLVKGDREL